MHGQEYFLTTRAGFALPFALLKENGTAGPTMQMLVG